MKKRVKGIIYKTKREYYHGQLLYFRNNIVPTRNTIKEIMPPPRNKCNANTFETEQTKTDFNLFLPNVGKTTHDETHRSLRNTTTKTKAKVLSDQIFQSSISGPGPLTRTRSS